MGAAKPNQAPLALFPTRNIWTLALNNPLTAPPAFDDKRVYFPIEGDRLVAYSIVEGEQRWLVSAKPLTQPAAGGENVFCAEDDDIVARRVSDGSIAWRHKLPGHLIVPPVWHDGWLVTADDSGSIQAARGEDGHIVWTRDLKTHAHASPAIAGDHVYVPTENSRVIALRIDNGDVAWEHTLGGPMNDLLVVGNRLYAGSQDNFLYCLMTKDGRIDWRWRTGGDVIGVPAADERHIYFVSLDNVLRSLDRITGAQQWMRPLPVRPVWGPVKVVDRLLVGGQSNTLTAFNIIDGKEAGTLDAGAEVAAAPRVISDADAMLPVVYVVTRDIAKGAAARLVTRRIEPPTTQLADPLPNVIPMNPEQGKRP